MILEYLHWTHLAVFMALTGLDLRPFLTDVRLELMLNRHSFLTLERSIDLELFRTVPAVRFWNCVALFKRLNLYPTMALAPSRMYVAKLWNNWPSQLCRRGTVRVIEFNPVHQVVATVLTDSSGKDFLCCHWYGGNGSSRIQHMEPCFGSTDVSISWSPNGTYLLCKISSSSSSNYLFFKTLKETEEMLYLRGLRLFSSRHRATSKLWISDSSFIFPGVEKKRFRVTRPWLFKLTNGGDTLIICQPSRELRKEHLKSLNGLSRGALQALENGQCCELSLCKARILDESSQHSYQFHSIVHFRDCKQNPTQASLAIPGLVLAVENLSSSKILVLYRQASQCDFYPSEMLKVYPEPLRLHGEPPCKKSKKMTKSKGGRFCSVEIPAPYFGFVDRGACLSESTSESDDEMPVETDSYPDSVDFQKLELRKCGRTSSPCCFRCVRTKREKCKLFVGIYNLETETVEYHGLSVSHGTLQGPFPETQRSAGCHIYEEDLLDEVVKLDDILSVTENLVIIRLKSLEHLGSAMHTLVLHKSQFAKKISHCSPLKKLTYMHPTKNLLVQTEPSNNCPFPIVVTCNLDMLSDCPVNLDLDQKLLEAEGKSCKRSIKFVVTDERGNVCEDPQLKTLPSRKLYYDS